MLRVGSIPIHSRLNIRPCVARPYVFVVSLPGQWEMDECPQQQSPLLPNCCQSRMVAIRGVSRGSGPFSRRRLAPILDQIAAEADERFRVGKVNAWDEPDLAVRYGIRVVPTLLVFK